GMLINIERLTPNLDEIFAAGIENNACVRLKRPKKINIDVKE
ncbi:hypothetical protein LCGC14_3065740, partial [marine sediment metagenome]